MKVVKFFWKTSENANENELPPDMFDSDIINVNENTAKKAAQTTYANGE